jgi:hypothetical protein
MANYMGLQLDVCVLVWRHNIICYFHILIAATSVLDNKSVCLIVLMRYLYIVEFTELLEFIVYCSCKQYFHKSHVIFSSIAHIEC